MDKKTFWQIIDSSLSEKDQDAQLKSIHKTLENVSPDQIIAFDHTLHELLKESYTWALWGAAYLINGGCSDDGFEYFRLWLISRGQSVYEKAIKDPDSLASLELPDDCEFERFWYIPNEIYEKKTRNKMPLERTPDPDLQNGWDFDDDQEMRSRYPRLYSKVS